MGYCVGQNGVSEAQRREILDFAYKQILPNVNSVEYIDEWGDPITWPRLSKIAESIASFVRSAKRRDLASMSVAIDEWESDLDYLRKKYYVGRYDSPWPPTHFTVTSN